MEKPKHSCQEDTPFKMLHLCPKHMEEHRKREQILAYLDRLKQMLTLRFGTEITSEHYQILNDKLEELLEILQLAGDTQSET